MNILMILFLSVAPQADWTCGQGNAPTTGFVRLGTTGLVATAEDDELLFYVDSHVQALSSTDETMMNPWLQLRPIGAVGQNPVSETPLARAIEPAPAGHGQDVLGRNVYKHDCT
jgi:hypothetical protein